MGTPAFFAKDGGNEREESGIEVIMRIADALPVYAAALPVRRRPNHIRVERPAFVPGLSRHGRIGDDGATYTDHRLGRNLPPHRGRYVDVLV